MFFFFVFVGDADDFYKNVPVCVRATFQRTDVFTSPFDTDQINYECEPSKETNPM